VTRVQIFGTPSCSDTRKAQRFFRERRVPVHFVDLKRHAASKGELRHFVQRHGAEALIDRESRRFHALGLRQASYGAERWLDILAEEPLLLRTPLVRAGNDLSIGLAQDDWRRWLDRP